MKEILELDPLVELDPDYVAWKVKLLKLKKENEAMRSYFEKIIDIAPGHLYWKNKEGVYLGCNLFMVHFCHLTSKMDIIVINDSTLWPHCAKALEAHDKQVMETGENLVFEETLHESKNRSIKMPLKDVQGNIIGVMGHSIDITELKSMKKTLIETREIAEAAMMLYKDQSPFSKPDFFF